MMVLDNILHTLSGLATMKEARDRMSANPAFPALLVTCLTVPHAARIMQHAASHAIACLRISLLHWSQVSGLEFPSSGSVRTGCAGLRKASRPALMHPGAAASAQRCADVH